MTLVETLSLWTAGVEDFEAKRLEQALDKFLQIKERLAKITYNAGVVCAGLHRLPAAIQYLSEAINRDSHMVVAYFQRGCVHYRLNRNDDAMSDFSECREKLKIHGKTVIDYGQLGLKYKLYACEVLYNLGVVTLKAGNLARAVDFLLQAQNSKEKIQRHECIEKLISQINQAGGLVQQDALLDLPADALFRPPKSKVTNMKQVDYLGKATVVSATDQNDRDTGFTGPRRLQEGIISSAPNSPLSPRHEKRFLSLGDIFHVRSRSPSPMMERKKMNGGADQTLSSGGGTFIPPPPSKPLPPAPPRKQPDRLIPLHSNRSSTASDDSGMDVSPQRSPQFQKRGIRLPVQPHHLPLHQKMRDLKLTNDQTVRTKDSEGAIAHSSATCENTEPGIAVFVNGRSCCPTLPPRSTALPSSSSSTTTSSSNSLPVSASPAAYRLPAASSSTLPETASQTATGSYCMALPPPRPPKMVPGRKPEGGGKRRRRISHEPPKISSLPRNKPLPDLPVDDETTPAATPSPPVVSRRQETEVRVELHCNGVRNIAVTWGTTLQSLLLTSGKEFSLQYTAYDLWRKREDDAEYEVIDSEDQMQNIWSGCHGNGLTLWIFSR